MKKKYLSFLLSLMFIFSSCDTEETFSSNDSISSDFSSTPTSSLSDSSSFEEEIWGEVSYNWESDYSKVTASRRSSLDNVETEIVTVTSNTISPDCINSGSITYTSSSFSNPAFEVQTKVVTLDPLNHDYNEASYVWNYDEVNNIYTVTANRVCKRDTSHVETETVATTANIVSPDCINSGSITYTSSSFSNPAFEVQTKVVTLDPLNHDYNEPTYIWNYDETNNKYIVTATRVCKRDSSHVETEEVEATYQDIEEATCHSLGLRRYLATFTNSAFTSQNRDVEIAMLPHIYQDSIASYLLNDEHTICHASICCSNDGCTHLEEEDIEIVIDEEYPVTCQHDGYVDYHVTFTNPVFESGNKRFVITSTGEEHNWVLTHVTYADFDPFDFTKVIMGEKEYTCSHCGKKKVEPNPDFEITIPLD